jgi:hypothetical protein
MCIVDALHLVDSLLYFGIILRACQAIRHLIVGILANVYISYIHPLLTCNLLRCRRTVDPKWHNPHVGNGCVGNWLHVLEESNLGLVEEGSHDFKEMRCNWSWWELMNELW